MNTKIKYRHLLTSLVALALALPVGAQTADITGRVLDPQGRPLAGAVVVVEGSATGTMTDANGNYKISAPAGARLNFSYGSYAPENRNVAQAEDGTFNVTLGLTAEAEQAASQESAQQASSMKITGKVTDEEGNPISGASVVVVGTTAGTISDTDGNYSLEVENPDNAKVTYSFVGYENETVSTKSSNSTYNVVLRLPDADEHDFLREKFDNGANKQFARAENVMSAYVISGEDLDHRLAKSINTSIIGQGLGLTSLDMAGNVFIDNPVYYLRGLHTLNDNNSPLILVDGIERNITTISPGEVESVTLLKDAVATALYGYKATNGVVLVTTKRGQREGNHIGVKYEHAFSQLVDVPEFVNAYEYALARNEGAAAEGKTLPYSDKALEAYNGDKESLKLDDEGLSKLRLYFPDVDWVKETFRQTGYSNRYSIDFDGRGKRFRYYTYLNLYSNKGYVKPTELNDGYSTQEYYSRGNLRSNLDIDMTDYTVLKVNVGGILSELQVPGAQANLWQLVYALPANAFPIYDDHGYFGSSTVHAGTLNPVAQASGAGYYKVHERGMQADMQLDQSLGMFVEGLSLSGRISYDNYAKLYENHSKTYVTGNYSAISLDQGVISSPSQTITLGGNTLYFGDYTVSGTNSELGTDANNSTYERRAAVSASVNYDKNLNDNNYLYAQVKWDYENSDAQGTNNTIYRQNFSWYSHFVHRNRYILDLALVGSESSRLAPDHKWDFSPNAAIGWVASNEDFLKNVSFVNHLKVRVSGGIQNADYLPNGSWSYYTRAYSKVSGGLYLFNDAYQGGSQAYMYTAPVEEFTNENAYKLNVGLDARLFGGLDLTFDFYRQRNKNIWVSGSGAYSAVVQLPVPYVNKGETKSGGVELSLDYNKKFGDVGLHLGGNISYTHDEIVEQAEEVRAYPNLVTTGDRIKSTRGLIAEGLFQSQAEIDAAPTQTFQTLVVPGDIRYRDVNGDGTIDANDKVSFGYSTTLPEVFYNFHVGADFKGFALNAFFQGVGRYTAIKNTQGYYWGLTDNASVYATKEYSVSGSNTGQTSVAVQNIAKEVYDDHWTAENPNAKYPRMAYQSNANNYQTSTFWQEDRSFLKLRDVELSYDFAYSLLHDTFVKKAKVYVRGVDLFTWDKLDNKDAAAYGNHQPLTRSVIAGVQLSF